MDFYAPLPDASVTMQQGDLLEDVPFAYFSLTDAKVLLASKRSARRGLIPQPEKVEFVAAEVQYSWGLVLSQTCDVQPDPQTGFARRPILVARVRPIERLYPRMKFDTPKNAVSSIKQLATAGSAPSTLFLPALEVGGVRFPRSGANLLDIQRFEPNDLPILTNQIRMRLTDPARQALQERCAYCFGRFAAPDALYYSSEEWDEIIRQEEARRQSQQRA